MDAVLGIDVGTTAIKALLLPRDGRPLSAHAAGYGLHSPRPGWYEQDPDELQRAVIEAVRAALAAAPAHAVVRGIGLSTQAAATVLLDGDGRPLTPIISWMDGRARTERDELTRQLGTANIQARTGRGDAGLLASLLLWFQRHTPPTFARVASIGTVEDLVCRWLTGRGATDASNAAITGMLRLADLDWDAALAHAAGIDAAQLPRIVSHARPLGALAEHTAATLGLPPGIAVAAPLHDQHAAALGAGVTAADQAMFSTGTAWVVFMRTADARLDLGPGLFRAPSVDGDGWGLIHAIPAGGGYLDRAMAWLGVSGYEEAERLAQDTSPDAGGVVFLPTLGDQRSAAWVGLGLSHQRGDLLRAVMNGLAGEAVVTATAMAGDGPLRKLVMLGGAAHSALWRRIVASMAQCPVEVPATVDAAALGAAVMGGVAVGWWSSPAEGRSMVTLPVTTVQPEPWGRACQQRFVDVCADGVRLAGIPMRENQGDNT